MRVTRRAALRALAGGGLAATAGFGVYGFAYERRHVAVTRASVPVRGLVPALAGLRIGLLSDIHFGRFMPPEMVAAASRLLLDERPDIIVLAGDFVTWTDRAAVQPCAEALGALHAPLGVFAVTGNHDPEPTIHAVFGARRVEVLRDEQARLTVRGEPVAVGGLRYWSRKTSDVSHLFEGARGTPILLAHDPRRLAQAAELGVPLVLAGHTHGGQVVIPGLGAPAAARFPVAAGLARQGGTTLFVTRGLGTVIVPVRLHCPPEVAVLTLVSG